VNGLADEPARYTTAMINPGSSRPSPTHRDHGPGHHECACYAQILKHVVKADLATPR
jgi:hypothetical protein